MTVLFYKTRCTLTNESHMLVLTNMFYTAATYTCSYDEATQTAKWSKYGPILSDCYLSLDYLVQQLYEGNCFV